MRVGGTLVLPPPPTVCPRSVCVWGGGGRPPPLQTSHCSVAPREGFQPVAPVKTIHSYVRIMCVCVCVGGGGYTAQLISLG